jgi:membrane associated rhomboid family serine protease
MSGTGGNGSSNDHPESWIEVSRSPLRKTVEDHALVLEATGIPSGIAVAFGQYVLLARAEDAIRARAELDKYVRENRDWPPQVEPRMPMRWSVGAAWVYAGVLVALDLAQRRDGFGLDWWAAGLADAAMIMGGAWWRCITALGLHADVLHVASNLAFGAVFGVMLAQSIGFGLAWLAFVVTGGMGNWVNAWLQSPSHTSIGASTAIFGMLGAQAAHDWVRRRQLHYNVFRRWAPIAMGAALLAWLGGDGRPIDPKAPVDVVVALSKIDVGAHVFGFGSGLVFGGLIGWSKPQFRSSLTVQAAAAAAAAGLFGAAWVLAFR